MKKFFILMSMVAAFVLSGCSKDDGVPAESTKGMTLMANVDQSETRATFTGWTFKFQSGDVLLVSNSERATSPDNDYYQFENVSGSTFQCSSASGTGSSATWFACYPNNTTTGNSGKAAQVSLETQSGTKADLYKYICYYGSQENVPAQTTTLTMELKPQVAIIEISNYLGAIKLCAKDGDSKYIYRMVSSHSGEAFTSSGKTSESRRYLLTASSNGTYYIAVPAQTAFTLYNFDNTNETQLKSISSSMLQAGKYYTLTLGTAPSGGTTQVYSYSASANSVTYTDGATLAITGDSGKNWGKGTDATNITVNGTKYTSIKNSNGAQNTFTAAIDNGTMKKIKSVTFYATTNDSSTSGVLSEIGGTTLDPAVEISSKKDGANPTSYKYDFTTSVTSFTFTFGTKQVFFVMNVEYE